MKHQAVLFDFYNTLAIEDPCNRFYDDITTELDLVRPVFFSAYRVCGPATMRGELYGMCDRVEQACRLSQQPRPRPSVERAVAAHMPAFVASVSLYDDAAACLEAVASLGMKTALVSNASSYSASILAGLRIEQLLGATVLSYQVGVLKPDPEIYLAACASLDTDPADCIFVGDGGDDELLGARRLGMTTVLIDRKLPHTLSAFEAANHQIGALRELSALIQSLGEPCWTDGPARRLRAAAKLQEH